MTEPMTLDEAIAELSRGMCTKHRLAEMGCATCEPTLRAIAVVRALAAKMDAATTYIAELAAERDELRRHADLHGYAALVTRGTPSLTMTVPPDLAHDIRDNASAMMVPPEWVLRGAITLALSSERMEDLISAVEHVRDTQRRVR